LNERQKAWLENTLQAERQQQKQIGHISTWQLLKHRQIWLMAAIGDSIKQPGSQVIKMERLQ
jgi:ACS family tartrate transporter-like MFS transporter